MFYAENLFTYNIMPIVSSIPGLNNLARPIKNAGISIMESVQEFNDWLLDT